MFARWFAPARRPARPARRLAVERLEDRAVPATLTVLTTADGGAGSLRQALADAAPGDTIDFAPAATGTIALGSSLAVDKSLTITGPGRDRLTVSGGANDFTGFLLSGAIAVTITGLTVADGHGYDTHGGGIHQTGSGSLAVADCAFVGNWTEYGGGGISHQGSGTLTVTRSVFSGNTAVDLFGPGYGGAIYKGAGSLTVTDSTFSGNSAVEGGGIRGSSFCTVVGSTFTGNSAERHGGGVRFNGDHNAVRTSTVTGNTAVNGGGLMVGHAATIANCTIVGNSSTFGSGLYVESSATLTNSVVALNPFGDSEILLGAGARLQSLGHNLIGSGDTLPPLQFVPHPSDQIGTTAAPLDPLVDALRDNGGPTPTMSPRFGSPAIDAGDDANGGLAVPAADQRGRPRIAGGTIDIGAFEVQPSAFQDEAEAFWTGAPGATGVALPVDQGTIGGHLAAVADVTPHPAAATPVPVAFDLGGNTVAGPTVRVPAGVTLTFTNGTFVGASPALTVVSGTVVVRHSTLTNATDAPTVRLVGGTLVLRDSVVQESPGFDQTAIRVEGGTLDLGTPADPGGNVINVTGAGEQLANAGGAPATLYGNTWQENGVAQAGGTVGSGQAAGVGFWSNKNGRVLINALGATADGVSRVGAWLATTFPNLYGSLLAGTPDAVWDYMKSLKAAPGTVKLEAQVMAVALSAYVTDAALNATALGRSTAAMYGLGLAGGSLGAEAAPATADQAAALGLGGGAGFYTVRQLLDAANAHAAGGWAFLAPADAPRRKAVHDLFAAVIASGE